MKYYTHILVPIDFSVGSTKAIERALELIKLYQAKISLVNIVEPLPAMAYSYMGSIDIEHNLIEHAQQHMYKWGQRYHIAEEDQHIVSGHAKTDIPKIAEKLGCDLIIIGSHSEHSLFNHLLGSTTDAVSHHANCDVLIVRKNND